MIEVKVSFDTDRQRALDGTRLWGALALSGQEKTSVEDPLEMERLADALPTERTASRWIVSTDPEEHVEQIRFYIDLGFNHLVFHAPGNDQRRFLDLYAEQSDAAVRRAHVTRKKPHHHRGPSPSPALRAASPSGRGYSPSSTPSPSGRG